MPRLMLRREFARVMMCAVFVAIGATSVRAEVKLPSIIGDNMVLQRDQAVPIWGWAGKGEDVSVSIAGQTLKTKTGDDGRWKVELSKLSVGEPLEMTIEGSSGSRMTLKNILVGEVWVCSGQSNMEQGLELCANSKEEIAAADYPNVRLFNVKRAEASKPAKDVTGAWKPCSPESIVEGHFGGFSAAAYYFGRYLHKELGVPVGLIDASWGGSAAERWMSRKVLDGDPRFKRPAQVKRNSSLYNAMLAPLMPYAIRGAIWYQGETNVPNAYEYRSLFPALIANWRADWGQGDFPFYFVQLSPFRYHVKTPSMDPKLLPELWEAQLMTLRSVPNTGMAVITDIGDIKDIHPKNKVDVGRRLALWALAKIHGRDVVFSGPLYKSMAVEGSRIRLQFDYVDGGLKSRDGKPLSDFIIAGEDKKFVPAVAEIDGESIIVHSEKVDKPVAVRFAWHEEATPNLSNKAGLPASPFRTDSWMGLTEPKTEPK